MLARIVYESGFEVMHPTAPSAIMERLCREGRAELVRYGFADGVGVLQQ